MQNNAFYKVGSKHNSMFGYIVEEGLDANGNKVAKRGLSQNLEWTVMKGASQLVSGIAVTALVLATF